MKADIKYLYDQAITPANQRTGKCYQIQINEYAVSEINDWENSNQCNFLSMQLHKKTTIKWYRI